MVYATESGFHATFLLTMPQLRLDIFCQNSYCHFMPTFAETIRTLRQQNNVPLRVVAAAVEIDSTLLSRLELGDRFPTDEQIKRFATYFQIPENELFSQVIADRVIAAYGSNEVMAMAADKIKERLRGLFYY
jgi:transcriptional regulator with XRE-family HTH domain